MAKQKTPKRFDSKCDEALQMRNSWLKLRDSFLEEFSADPRAIRSSKIRKVYRNLEQAFGKFDKVTAKVASKVLNTEAKLQAQEAATRVTTPDANY